MNRKFFFLQSLFFVLLLSLNGCTSVDTLKTEGASRSARAADEQLDIAIWTICNASTNGALMRKFGDEDNFADLLAFWGWCKQMKAISNENAY